MREFSCVSRVFCFFVMRLFCFAIRMLRYPTYSSHTSLTIPSPNSSPYYKYHTVYNMLYVMTLRDMYIVCGWCILIHIRVFMFFMYFHVFLMSFLVFAYTYSSCTSHTHSMTITTVFTPHIHTRHILSWGLWCIYGYYVR